MRGSTLESFVIPPLIKCLSRITKLGWLIENSSQEVLAEIKKFIGATVDHKILGVKIYSTLISELDTPQHSIKKLRLDNPTQDDRKIAYYFRELYLHDIFVTTIELLDNIRMATIDMTPLQKVILLYYVEIFN